MTVVRNEPSFVSIIGKLDAMSFQLETKEFLIYDLPRIPFHFLATKNSLNIASNDVFALANNNILLTAANLRFFSFFKVSPITTRFTTSQMILQHFLCKKKLFLRSRKRRPFYLQKVGLETVSLK